MSEMWGKKSTDYVKKLEGACVRCNQKRYMCGYLTYLCAADSDIKSVYARGGTKDAIAMLRGMPSEMLRDYLHEKRRTPTELKAVILDELQVREKEEQRRL